MAGSNFHQLWDAANKDYCVTLSHRVVANILIALGALLPAAGGIHISVNGNLNLFFLFELAGVIIMFIGFLRTKEVFGLYRFPLIHGFKKVE
jgi:hypothetical protein